MDHGAPVQAGRRVAGALQLSAKFDAAAIARLEQRHALPAIVEQRRQLRALLAAQPGETGLDIGCGAGYLACDLARDVAPGGSIAAIDESHEAVDTTRARAEREGLDAHVHARVGNAVQLEYPSGSFDFAVASQVYCYVPDVEAALREVRRVLREGGRLLVLDSDWDLCLYRSSDDALTRRLVALRSAAQFAHADLPRRLPQLMSAAGFKRVDVSATAIVETRYGPESFGAGFLPRMREEGAKHGISDATLSAWERDLRSRTGEGEWFYCLNRFMFMAS